MKKKTKGLFIAVSFMLALSFCRGLVFSHKNVAKAQSLDFDCNFICSDEKDTNNYVNYGCKELVEYTEEQAETADIPKGFSGEVLSVVSDVTNRGITLDFSSKKIPTVFVDSITFRVYVGGDGIPSDESEIDESVSGSANDSDEQSQDQNTSDKGCAGTLGGAGLLSLLLTASVVCFKKRETDIKL